MCSDELKILDKIDLNLRIETLSCCDYTKDNKLSIVCSGGVYILELMGYTNNWLPHMSFKKFLCDVSPYCIASNVGLDINNFIDDLPRLNLYETVLDVRISENLQNSSPVPHRLIQVKWSPSFGNNFNMLAVIDNFGVVYLIEKHISDYMVEGYKVTCNVTEKLIEQFTSKWTHIKNFEPEKCLEILRNRIQHVTATACIWSNAFKEEDTVASILFVSHMDGGLSSWKVNLINGKGDIKFVGHFDIGITNITAMRWVPSKLDGKYILYIQDCTCKRCMSYLLCVSSTFE